MLENNGCVAAEKKLYSPVHTISIAIMGSKHVPSCGQESHEVHDLSDVTERSPAGPADNDEMARP